MVKSSITHKKLFFEGGIQVNIIGLIVFSVITTLKFFIPCYFGSNIQYISQNFLYDVYQIDWIDASKEEKTNLTITQENLKKYTKLTVAKLFHINLETFLRVLNFSYSLFTVLKHINSCK